MKAIGLLPAAGSASRLGPFRYPKELLPIHFAASADGNGLEPSLVIEWALGAMHAADIESCYVVVAEDKPEILRYLRDGGRYGLALSYLVQSERRGLAHAVDCAFHWVRASGAACYLALPDSVFTPTDSIRQVRALLETRNLDLVLGVFATDHPERLGPVEVDASGRVSKVHEKPPEPVAIRNTWGVAGWSQTFAELLHERIRDADLDEEVVLGHVFDEARREDLHVAAITFPDGSYHDLGTPAAIGEFAAFQRAEPEPVR